MNLKENLTYYAKNLTSETYKEHEMYQLSIQRTMRFHYPEEDSETFMVLIKDWKTYDE